MKRLSLATLALMLVSSCASFAQNLVTNGGFETGDFTGWTQFGDTSYSGVCPAGSPSQDCSGFDPHSGLWMASFGPVNAQGGITQTLNTVAGEPYLISFFLSNGEDSPNSFLISFDGVTLVSGTDVGYMHWQFFQFTQIASSDSTVLSFSFYQVPDYFDLDDVAVVAETPEPASLTLLGSALALGVGFVHKIRS